VQSELDTTAQRGLYYARGDILWTCVQEEQQEQLSVDMEWLQVSVPVGAELAEAVADVLGRFAPGGVAIDVREESVTGAEGRVIVKAYLPVSPDTSRAQQQVEEALWHLGQISPIPAPIFTPIAEADWADAWKEHFHPIRVGQHIVIKPTWREFEAGPNDIILELDPGMAFGTGLHPTTQMCLRVLEEKIRQGMKVLDLGTGSGILALAAGKLGAGTVLALDTDPVAVAAARENVWRNGVEQKVTVAHGSLEQAAGTYHLVVVNILARVIIALAQGGLGERVRPGGEWVTAGIIEPQVRDVVAALDAGGLEVTGQLKISDWVTLIGRRHGDG
jgi:ribosomal protein L11 methyltransferase